MPKRLSNPATTRPPEPPEPPPVTVRPRPARVVVHWRYPLVDVLHVLANHRDDTGWGDWADWYYYIYPDGGAAKQRSVKIVAGRSQQSNGRHQRRDRVETEMANRQTPADKNPAAPTTWHTVATESFARLF